MCQRDGGEATNIVLLSQTANDLHVASLLKIEREKTFPKFAPTLNKRSMRCRTGCMRSLATESTRRPSTRSAGIIVL
jgi:hypothetical protein